MTRSPAGAEHAADGRPGAGHDLRRRIYDVLDATPHSGRAGAIVSRLIEAMILASVTATVLETVPSLEARYGVLFAVIEAVVLVAFTAEYILRIWIAPEHLPYREYRGIAARRAYVLSAQGLIDLLAVAPLWIASLGYDELRVLIVLRILRIFKFARYSSGMRSLLDVLWSERRALTGCLVILGCTTLVSASVMHVVEGHAQPDKFGTIPEAMWWSIVTLTTIGYGDVVPVTGLGKAIAALTIVTGLIMVALPVGIVATAFSEVIHRRDFIVTWSMVARVPLFSRLTAGDIAHVMQLLRAQQAERGDVILRRGEPAHAMYFIAEGEVEIELGHDGHSRLVRLGPGHFFGERAVLRQTKRTSTVVATSRTKLLVLAAADLRALIAREPVIAEHINQVALHRGARHAPIPTADETDEADAGD
jgi:voltage-gated potassium channel